MTLKHVNFGMYLGLSLEFLFEMIREHQLSFFFSPILRKWYFKFETISYRDLGPFDGSPLWSQRRNWWVDGFRCGFSFINFFFFFYFFFFRETNTNTHTQTQGSDFNVVSLSFVCVFVSQKKESIIILHYLREYVVCSITCLTLF